MVKKCVKCGEKKTLYYVGNDALASPIYYCKDCKNKEWVEKYAVSFRY